MRRDPDIRRVSRTSASSRESNSHGSPPNFGSVPARGLPISGVAREVPGSGSPGKRELTSSVLDLSSVAVSNARERAEKLGLADVARFAVGAFDDTALESGSVQGVMSVDALQYAPDKRAAFREVNRILSAGGRFAFTVFEVDPERVAGLPVISADPVDDVRPLLEELGLRVEVYEETESWQARLVVRYEAVQAKQAELLEETTEEAVTPLLMEVALTLEHMPYRRRMLVGATKL
jgi:ubiquinone/menaquinone biosynthesis C-methylase UbiE